MPCLIIWIGGSFNVRIYFPFIAKKLNNKKRFWALSKLTIVLATKRLFVLEPKRKLTYTIRAPPERILNFISIFKFNQEAKMKK